MEFGEIQINLIDEVGVRSAKTNRMIDCIALSLLIAYVSYSDYSIRQCAKSGARVCVNTASMFFSLVSPPFEFLYEVSELSRVGVSFSYFYSGIFYTCAIFALLLCIRRYLRS